MVSRDTGFHPRWFDPEIHRTFNCDNLEISAETIRGELLEEEGRRAFHPVRRPSTLERALEWIAGPSRGGLPLRAPTGRPDA